MMPAPVLMRSSALQLSRDAEAWTAFWQPMPKAGWHDLLALTKRGEATLEGDIKPFMTHLQYFKDLLALPRNRLGRCVMTGYIEPIVGRYVHVDIDGTMHRIYFEEAGHGHSAGLPAHRGLRQSAVAPSAGRRGIHKTLPHHRFRYALAWQVESASRIGAARNISSPPTRYTETIRAFCAALELDGP